MNKTNMSNKHKMNMLLFKHSKHTAFYNFILACAVVYFLPISNTLTIVWLTLMLLCVLIRFTTGVFAKKMNTNLTLIFQFLSIWFTGLLWGYIYWSTYSIDNQLQSMIIMLILTGASAASLASMASSKLCFQAFILPMFTAIYICNLMPFSFETIQIIIISTVYYIFLVAVHNQNYKLLLKSHKLEVKRSWLISMLHKKNQTDHLTGIFNRKTFRQIAQRSLASAKSQNKNLTIIFCDLDHFKEINDKYGHHMGDEVLKYFAKLLKKNFTEHYVARMGGDEFALIINHLEHLSQLRWITNKIINLMPNEVFIQKHKIKLTTSLGAASYPEHGNHIDQLEKNADISLYKAKALGRNQYVLFSQELYNEHLQTEIIFNAINKPFQESFTFKYQPIYHVSSKKKQIKGIELLLRPNHQLDKQIQAEDIITIAERNGQMHTFGFYLLNIAFNEISHLSKLYPDYFFTVNISTHLIKNNKDHQRIIDMLYYYGLNPGQVVLEITESAFTSDHQAIVEGINLFKSNGLKIAIDDFGKGYSSLSRLNNIAADILKLDMEFIHNLESCINMQHIVKLIIELAHSLNLNIIAEGVETENQLKIIQQLGCTNIQGYLLCVPLSKEELLSDKIHQDKTMTG